MILNVQEPLDFPAPKIQLFPKEKYVFFFRVFFNQDFLSQTLMIHRTAGEGMGSSLFLSTTSICSGRFRHLFATWHVSWVPPIFNCTTYNYQTSTQWNWPTLGICIWLIITWMLLSFLHVNLMLYVTNGVTCCRQVVD